jgi:hypothetical protein
LWLETDFLAEEDSSNMKRQSDTEVVADSNRRPNNEGKTEGGFPPSNHNTATTAAPKLRVRIRRFHGVAKWTWNAGSDDDEVCGICQSAFEGVAPVRKTKTYPLVLCHTRTLHYIL